MWDYGWDYNGDNPDGKRYHFARCNHCGRKTSKGEDPDAVREWMAENDWSHPAPVSMYCPRCRREGERRSDDMSYCRFINGDVYVYDSADGLVCDFCSLLDGDFGYVIFKTRSGMIAHLQEHVAIGDHVGGAIVRLRAEIETEGDEWKP